MEDLSKEETNQNMNDLPGNEIDNSTSNQIGIVDEPTVGMLFNSQTDVYSYYSTYARTLGFSIAKRSKKVGDEGEVKYFALECSRAGKRPSNTQNLKPRLSTKTMCQARLRASLQKDGKFRLTTVSLEHNHDLSPRKARYFRCNKNLDNNVKRRLELNDEAGISVCKNFNSLVIEAGSYDNLTFGEKDCRNYIDKARRLRLGVGDGEAIKNYFQRMQESNSNSFYLMDLDDESRVKRWRKGLKRGYTFVTTNYNNINCEPSMLRYDKMCAEFFEVGKIAADCEDRCDLVLSNLRELKTMLLAMDTVLGNETLVIDGFKSCESESNLLKQSSKVCSPIARKRKGRPPSKRKVSNVEKAVQQVRKKKKKQVEECKLTNMNRKKILPNDESSLPVCSPIGVEDHQAFELTDDCTKNNE